ncbi:MAG: FMN-binding glutamate synthase family protein [Planctomycetes bacterium]|nr:FMN-binding glutamate synthase family protein [Planctomycetota bacterium]
MKTLWTQAVVRDIQEKARIGRYRIRGFGAHKRLVGFDDLSFRMAASGVRPSASGVARGLPAVARIDVTVIGGRFAENPLQLDIPILAAPMSFGAVSKGAKIALAKGAARAGTASGTGEGGMLEEERAAATKLIYQLTPGRYGFNPHDLRRADAVEIYISQGAKPGLGGQLLASKVTDEIARVRQIPQGIDLRSPSRHGDILGADDLVIKVEELREASDWRIPVGLKIGAGRVREDMKIAAKVGVDYVALDGMQGGTGASPEVVTENMGIPVIAAVVQARHALEELGLENEVDLVLMGGIRNGADAAKAIALGAKAVAVGTAALLAMGCVACMQCHTGKCPVGIATQDPQRIQRLDIEAGARAVATFLRSMAQEMSRIAASCGRARVHELGRGDLEARTRLAAAVTGLPLGES